MKNQRQINAGLCLLIVLAALAFSKYNSQKTQHPIAGSTNQTTTIEP